MPEKVSDKAAKNNAAKLPKVLWDTAFLLQPQVRVLVGEFGADFLATFLAIRLALGAAPGAALHLRYVLSATDLAGVSRSKAEEVVRRCVEEGLLSLHNDVLQCSDLLSQQVSLEERRVKWRERQDKYRKSVTRDTEGGHASVTSAVTSDSLKEEEEEEEEEEEPKGFKVEGVQGETPPAAKPTPPAPARPTKAKPTKVNLNTREALTTALSVRAPDLVTDEVISALVDWARGVRYTKRTPITEGVMDGIARDYANNPTLLLQDLRTCIERGWVGIVYAQRDRAEQQAKGTRLTLVSQKPNLQSQDELDAVLSRFSAKEIPHGKN